MSKKELDKKRAKQLIIEDWEKGQTNQEIYFTLSEQYYDKKAIALLITGTATENQKKKYKFLNSILLFLLGSTILLKVWMIVFLSLDVKNLWLLLSVFIVPILNILFFISVAKYEAQAYRFCAFFAVYGFLNTAMKSQDSTDILISFILCGLITYLGLFLDSKLFPNYKPFNLRKGTNGDYII